MDPNGTHINWVMNFKASDQPVSVFKYFSVAGEVFLYIYLSDTSRAPEKPEKPEKYLKTPLRRRRSIYTQFSGAGEVVLI